MNRRLSLLTGALVLSLAVPQAAITTAAATTEKAAVQQPAVTAERDPEAEEALGRLRADAHEKLRVHRAADGVVDFVSSTDGEAMVEARGTKGPSRTALDQLARYGEAFGIDGGKSRAVVTRTFASATGGTIVRADQVVDGVPVFGGQVVMSLDADQGVVSVHAATTEGTEVPAPVVSESAARRSALAVTTKSHKVSAASLTVEARGRRLYDPAVVDATDHLGVRPVWEFEVGDGSEIRETVLVGTGRGEIALHFNDNAHLNRVVCDNASARTLTGTSAVPVCTAPARSEGGGAAGVAADVNAAYDNLGAASTTYDELAGIDLTELIGTGTPKLLMATVRWCFVDEPCPYANAFWDGTQMVFGAGYAAADDVVAHELTHGYVDKTSALFMLHQSGALNESLADVIGEVVDHRFQPTGAVEDNNSAWDLGEDVPGGAVRNLADPTRDGQPDKMTSPNYSNKDAYFDAGAVHANAGVGNKTAYLISQGGSFNGRTVTGIDGGDAGLAKTGLLYLEVIPRLTSGAQYADLGRVLATTCDELVAASTAGFTDGDCASVRTAAAATELALPPANPAAAPREAPLACTAGTTLVPLRRDDDNTATFEFSQGNLWQRTPQNGTPGYARSGTSSWFGWNPDPTIDGVYTSALTSAAFGVPASQVTFLHFNHAYLFEWYDADDTYPAYPDGGQVLVQTLNAGRWITRSVPWDNGPDRSWGATTAKVFGGDSRGYGSSRVNLSSLGGQVVRVVFNVLGDQDTSLLGWWLDDVRLYTCPNSVASVPRTTAAVVAPYVRVNWSAPAYVGSSPVASYRITRSDGRVTSAPGSARSTTLGSLNPSGTLAVSVAAVNGNGQVGAAATVRVYPTGTAVGARRKVRRGALFTVTGRVVRRGTTSVVSGMPVILQRRPPRSSVWRNVITGTTDSRGIEAWRVRQRRATYYRVVARGVHTTFWSTSVARLVRKR